MSDFQWEWETAEPFISVHETAPSAVKIQHGIMNVTSFKIRKEVFLRWFSPIILLRIDYHLREMLHFCFVPQCLLWLLEGLVVKINGLVGVEAGLDGAPSTCWSCGCPCAVQGDWSRQLLRVFSTSNASVILVSVLIFELLTLLKGKEIHPFPKWKHYLFLS